MLILAFFRTFMYQTMKCMQTQLYGEIRRLYEKPVFLVFLSMLVTKTINNIEVILCGNPKQNYFKRVFFVFYLEKR